jgi:hypothetical protein
MIVVMVILIVCLFVGCCAVIVYAWNVTGGMCMLLVSIRRSPARCFVDAVVCNLAFP